MWLFVAVQHTIYEKKRECKGTRFVGFYSNFHWLLLFNGGKNKRQHIFVCGFNLTKHVEYKAWLGAVVTLSLMEFNSSTFINCQKFNCFHSPKEWPHFCVNQFKIHILGTNIAFSVVSKQFDECWLANATSLNWVLFWSVVCLFELHIFEAHLNFFHLILFRDFGSPFDIITWSEQKKSVNAGCLFKLTK